MSMEETRIDVRRNSLDGPTQGPLERDTKAYARENCGGRGKKENEAIHLEREHIGGAREHQHHHSSRRRQQLG
jgi:hypothetical protein